METDEELLAGVEGEKAVFSNLSVSIDGVEVPDIDSYWATSEPFDLVAIEDNILGVEAGTQVRNAVGGWFVIIPPLEPGSHTIVVKDDIDDLTNEDPPTTASSPRTSRSPSSAFPHRDEERDLASIATEGCRGTPSAPDRARSSRPSSPWMRGSRVNPWTRSREYDRGVARGTRSNSHAA